MVRLTFPGRSARPTTTKRGLRVESLEPRQLLSADPIVAEFQAVNETTLTDEDGDTSDWIEIRNPDTQPVDLTSWYLTDNLADPTLWQFPPGSNIAAGSELLVFASGKDRSNGPGGELHTNFSLSRNGESIALVRPDGVTVVDAYESYPPQQPDQSYGLAVGRDAVELVGKDSPVQLFVPTDGSLEQTWQQVGFDDSQWQTGTLGVGYEQLASGYTDAADFNQPLGPEWTVDLPAGSSSTVLQQDGKLLLNTAHGDSLDFDERGMAPIVYRDLPEIPNGVTSFEVIAHVTQSPDQRGRAGIAVINEDGLPAIQVEYSQGRTFRARAEGSRSGSIVTMRDLDSYFFRLQRTDNFWTTSIKANAEDAWREVSRVVDGDNDRALINNPRVGVYATTTTTDMNVVIDQFDIVVPDETATYGPRISTELAEMNGMGSSVYLRMPFQIATDPAEFDEFALSASADDGFVAYLNGAPLRTVGGEPLQVNAPIVSTWDSTAASEVDVAGGASIPVGQFNVASSIGDLRQGENVLAIHGLNAAVLDRDFFFEATLAAASVVDDVPQNFVTPTPGRPNELPAAPVPIIEAEQGLFFGTTTLRISLPDATPALEIRYTTDGSVPTRESAVYSGQLTLSSSAMLQARTFDAAEVTRFAPSNPASGTFIAVDPALRDFSSNLPVLVLDGFGSLPIDASNDLVNMNVVMIDTSKVTGRTSLDASAADIEYLGRGGARDRGSSTANQPKPNMTFETWGSTGTTKNDDQAVDWLGLGSEADWVLHAPLSFDRTYSRNPLAFDLSNEMGWWAPNYRFVEVYLDSVNRNGQRDGNNIISQDDFMGIYVLMEKVEQGPNRVDIAETTPEQTAEPDITGGYIWKFDRADPDAAGFVAGGRTMNWVYPKSPESTSAREDQKATALQQQWVTSYFDQLDATLQSPDVNDPNGYTQYIDPVSWADYHLLNVYLDNVDAFVLSAYLFKDQGERIEMGPNWDFDRSAESNDDRDDDPTRWGGSGNSNFFDRAFFGPLFDDPGFWQLYIDRWQMWRETTLSDENVLRTLDAYQARLTEGAARAPFSQTNGRTLSNYRNNQLDGTYAGEFNNLRQWLLERGRFMDENFAARADVIVNGMPLGQASGSVIPSHAEIIVSPPKQEVFYDDLLVDPTVAIGSYLVIGDDDLGDRWTARNFDDDAWETGPLGFGYGTRLPEELLNTAVEPRATVPGSTTFLTRIDFELSDLAALQGRTLLLQANYDDGIVVYLNGEKLLEDNLEDEPLAWNSEAKTVRSPEEAREYDLTPFLDLLVEGTNTLAIRVINGSPTNSDMMIYPTLISREVALEFSPNAIAYYTLDGTDPRAADGQPSANAIGLIGGSEPVIVEPGTRLTVRNFDASYRGPESEIVLSNWSGPRVYNLISSGSASLEISEINYHPAEPTSAEEMAGYTSDDFEFVEVRNSGTSALNLNGVRLTDGVEFDFFGSGQIDAGQHVLVVANQAAFELRYGNGLPVVGEFTGNLDNNGEDVDLRDGLDNVVFSVNYADSDPWPVMADGQGPSLELMHTGVAREAQNKWYSWQSSSVLHGTPGADNSQASGVVINEVLAAPANNQSDSIELHNPTGAPIDISGWYLSDTVDNLFAFNIPNNTVIPSQGYVVFDADDFDANNDPEGFGLSRNGDSVYLVQGTKNVLMPQGGIVSQYADDVHFRATLTGESLGRVPNGSGRLAPLSRTTFNTANVDPRVGPLLITEVQFNPQPSAAALAADPTLEASDLEFIEVHNTTTAAVGLTDWRIRGGGDYNFPDGMTLAGGEFIVVLKFDPDDPENINQVNAFRAHYGIDSSVRLVGGYSGQLNNGDDLVVLLRPDVTGDPDDRPLVQEDEVLYDNLPPWPTTSERGFALQRRDTSAFGNDAASWLTSGVGSPGMILNELPGDFNSNSEYDSGDIDLLFAQMRSPTPDPAYDLNQDGQVDDADRDHLVQDTIGVAYGDANFDGRFNSDDLRAVFAAGEYFDDAERNSVWATGDWNGDGEFDADDLLLAFQEGDYE